MRTILCEPSVQQYLEHQLEFEKFSFGIIIGQQSKQNGKEYVIHLARTPQDSIGGDGGGVGGGQTVDKVQNVDGISAALLVDHALSAIRMMPGGFNVLGIYVVCPSNIFECKDDFRKLKIVLKQLADVLSANQTMYACTDDYDNGEKLILHYAGRRALTCKSIEIVDLAKAGNGRPVDWKFQDKGTQWQQIETIYDTDYIYPLNKRPEKQFDLEKNISITIEKIIERLESSIVFINGEPFDPSQQVETILKKLKDEKNEPKVLHGSIYLPCKEKNESKVINCEGTMKYSGIICSRIWVTTKSQIEDLQKFIKADILRSLSSRLRLYLDTTTCVETPQELDYIFVTEPPRRVFFELKSSSIMFCDYLFRGEGEETIINQAKDILDVELNAQKIVENAETSPEICSEEDLTHSTTVTSSETQTSPRDSNRLLCILGIVFAVGILFISIGFHFIFNYD